jgi:acetyl-CoA carboxylase carboxyl transferase subunit alpha
VPIQVLKQNPGARQKLLPRNLKEMSFLKVPVICVIIGEGASGGAIGIGVGDKVYMLENTWYSVISPESCSSILWRSWDFKEQAAEALKLTAEDMTGFGLVDGIIKEPLGGAHTDLKWLSQEIKKTILDNIKEISSLSEEDMIARTNEKFCNMGVVKG